jgi:signal transduction histidine kinase
MRWVRVSSVLLLAAVAVGGALTPVLLASGRGTFDDLAVALVVTTYIVVAVVIEIARPGHPVGLLMLAGATAWGVGEALLAVAVRGLHHQADAAAYVATGVLGSAVRGGGWLVLVIALPLVFPDGRAPWRSAVLLTAGCITAFTAASLLAPEPLEDRLGGSPNPIGLPEAAHWVTDVLAVGALAVAFGCLGLAVWSLVRRWRRGTDLVRQQVLVFGAAFAVPLLLLPVVATPIAEPWMFALATLPVPVVVGVALLQRRLYDVHVVVNRTVTYSLLSVVLAATYALVIGGVGAMLRDGSTPWLPWAAAGVVAVAFAPLRDSLQRAANRVTYGAWSVPGEVLAESSRRLTDAADGRTLLRDLTHVLVHDLGLHHAEIRDSADQVLAASGTPGATSDQVELTAYGATVGTLVWSGSALRRADRSLLLDLAHQMGGVVHAARLVDQLEAAHERLVLAREQERRRLRRDLHDGLGPSLAGLGLQVDTVQNLLLAGRPVGDRLDELRTGLRGTVVEVRRIVEELRPAALDDLGLFGAVRELGHQLADGSGVALTLDLPTDSPPLPAAVEVAAYRITQEALTNVVRHAGAGRCRVLARVTHDALELEVSDDGCGGAQERAGVGMGSMRERAGEIGGRLEVRSPGGGTTIALRLPLRAGAAT